MIFWHEVMTCKCRVFLDWMIHLDAQVSEMLMRMSLKVVVQMSEALWRATVTTGIMISMYDFTT